MSGHWRWGWPGRPGCHRNTRWPARQAGLAALTASARLIISGDTGMAHLATAYARPSVTLFGPVPPAEWGPPARPWHQVLWGALDGYRGDPHGAATDPALARITVAGVLDAAEQAQGAAPSGS